MRKGMTHAVQFGGGLKGVLLGGMVLILSAMDGQDTLHSPLAIPLQFSGNFGEIRTGHFHTGMDIRTGGAEGVPVLAAQTGRISRIKVSHLGYGLALYLDGGGLTTVYAHLSAFHPDIEAWLKQTQYAAEQWAFDGAPSQTFAFSAGDTLGWSGNSGRSFGPHLHFEVRDRLTQWPLNPLRWAFEGEGVTADVVPPEFKAVWVMPVAGATVESEPVRFRWSPAYGEGVRVAGGFRLGVEAFDRLDGEPFTHGPYGMDVWLDSTWIHSHRMDTLDFSTNGDVSAHIDLAAWQDRRTRIHRLHRLPGNRLAIYQAASGMEPLTLAPGDSARLRIRLLDMAGNETVASMWLVGDSVKAGQDQRAGRALDHRNRHLLRDGRIQVELPAGSLYGDAEVIVQDDSTGVFGVLSEARMTRSRYSLAVPVPEEWSGSEEPLVVCSLDDQGEPQETWVADEKGGYVQVRLTSFGRFDVRRDTLGPKLGSPRIHAGELQIPVQDDLTGVDRWEARCGGRWIRLGFEKGVLRHPLADGVLQEGEDIRVYAVDEAGNLSHLTFSWPLD